MTHIVDVILLFVSCVHLSFAISLYDDTEDVIEVNGNDFQKTVFDKETVFVVEFYSSSCGHCISFAPHYKRFAEDVRDWKSVVKIGAINCPEQYNRDVCSDYDIKSYPSIKVFWKPGDRGQNLVHNGHSVNSLRHDLVDYLLKLLPKGVPLKWPNLGPIYATQKLDLISSVPLYSDVPVCVIIENHNSRLSVETILDLSSYKDQIIVSRVIDNSNALINEIIEENVHLPALVEIHKNESVRLLSSSNGESNEELRKKFSSTLKQIYVEELITDKPNTRTSGGRSTTPVPAILPYSIYMVDLHNALRYSLYNEVTRFKTLNETQVKVLRAFINLIQSTFPFQNENVLRFFNRMKKWISDKSAPLPVVKLKAAMKISDGFIHPLLDWKACRGSSPIYRGYSCSLWILFHTLTVAEYQKNPDKNNHTTLYTMRDFIHHFFSCKQCAEHFYHTATTTDELERNLHRPYSSILWLWKVHNDVNLRLRGQESEDPKHPKQQYPTRAQCPNCYRSEKEADFNEDSVLSFLINHYQKTSIITARNYSPSIGLNFYLALTYLLIQLSSM